MKLTNDANTEFKDFPDGYESFAQFQDKLFTPLLDLARKARPRDFQVRCDPSHGDIEIFMASPCHNKPRARNITGGGTYINLSKPGIVEMVKGMGSRRANGNIELHNPTMYTYSFPVTGLGWDDDPQRTPRIVAEVGFHHQRLQ